MRRAYLVGKAGPWSADNDDATPVNPLSAGTSEATTRPCNGGMGPHEGIPLRMDVYDASGWIWPRMADCSACGGTVARTAFLKRIA